MVKFNISIPSVNASQDIVLRAVSNLDGVKEFNPVESCITDIFITRFDDVLTNTANRIYGATRQFAELMSNHRDSILKKLKEVEEYDQSCNKGIHDFLENPSNLRKENPVVFSNPFNVFSFAEIRKNVPDLPPVGFFPDLEPIQANSDPNDMMGFVEQVNVFNTSGGYQKQLQDLVNKQNLLSNSIEDYICANRMLESTNELEDNPILSSQQIFELIRRSAEMILNDYQNLYHQINNMNYAIKSFGAELPSVDEISNTWIEYQAWKELYLHGDCKQEVYRDAQSVYIDICKKFKSAKSKYSQELIENKPKPENIHNPKNMF